MALPRFYGPFSTKLLYALNQCEVDPITHCYNWPGAKNQNGYGQIRKHGQTVLASREIWAYYLGKIPVGLNVLHICNNPACVSIEHLYLGTKKENSLQASRELRYPQRITKEQEAKIHELTKLGLTQQDIADLTGISRITVGKYVRMK